MVVTTVGMEKRESCDIYRPWENIAMKGDIVCIVIRLTLFYQCILKLVLISLCHKQPYTLLLVSSCHKQC